MVLEKILETCQYVVDNSQHVKINYAKTDELITELLEFDNTHYLAKVPYKIYEMDTKDIINFILIYDAIDFSFWGNPKWTIETNGQELDGGMALLHCIYNLFAGKNSEDVYKELANITFDDFKEILKGNVEIPLLKERYEIVKSIAKIVNEKMHSNFYDYVKDLRIDKDIFELILQNFSNFEDIREYKEKIIYLYKLAQLLTSDILHVIENKEKVEMDYTNLVGCADYKIPQVLQGLGILEYDEELSRMIENKTPITESSAYEVEIRANLIIVINHIWLQINQTLNRIDINDFIWTKGQDKTKTYQPYHLTRTINY